MSVGEWLRGGPQCFWPGQRLWSFCSGHGGHGPGPGAFMGVRRSLLVHDWLVMVSGHG